MSAAVTASVPAAGEELSEFEKATGLKLARQMRHKCPRCGWTYAVGEFGPGTLIEKLCQGWVHTKVGGRDVKERCKHKFMVYVPPR